MARGILQRVTPHHYNLYNEEETLVGRIHALTGMEGHPGIPPGEIRWYGHHESGRMTAIHHNRHDAAEELMGMPGDVPPL